MNSKNRTPINIVLLVAAGFMVVAGLDFAAYWFKSHRDHTPMEAGRIAVILIPLVIGIVILAMSPKIAKRINEFLDQ